jgi:hypothetical protein
LTNEVLVDPKGINLQPQAEFNIVQNNIDQLLLEAIKEIFDNKGGVYVKPNEMAVVTF